MQVFIGSFGVRLYIFQYDLLQFGIKTANRLADITFEKGNDRFGKRNRITFCQDVFFCKILVTIKSAMSPTTFELGVTLTISPNNSFTSR